MSATLTRKWWLILIQGILLILLSFYIFTHPVAVLASLSFWFGLAVLLAGIIGVAAWISTEKSDRENISLFWSLATAVFGILLLLNLLVTMTTIAVIFGIWILLTGIQLIQLGWSIQKQNSNGLILIIAGVLSIIIAIMMIFNIGTAAVGISVLLGFQVLIAGIGLVIFAFVKKRLIKRITSKQ
jgi:uncharacterized membrane protein HdeD (DUF308 family)